MRIGIQNRFSDYGRGAMTAAPTTSSATNTLANQVSTQSTAPQSLNTVGSSKTNWIDPASIAQQTRKALKMQQAENELNQAQAYFEMMKKDPQTYSTVWLQDQVKQKIISTNVYRIVMARYTEWLKGQPQQVDASISIEQKRSNYYSGQMDKNSLAYIDALPEILGFRFDPNLYVESGHMDPLVGDNVPVEYELAYMQNIEKSLQDILDLFKAPRVSKSDKMEVSQDDVFLQVHGALKPDGTLNPYFYSNFYYNLLGLDEDADGWPLKRGNFELGTVGTEEMMMYAPQRLSLAQVGVQSVMASMQALQAQAEELAVQEQELIRQQAQLGLTSSQPPATTASQTPAATEETKASWLADPKNQIIVGVGGLAAAFALYKMFSK